MKLPILLAFFLLLPFLNSRGQEATTLEDAINRDLTSGKFTFLLGRWPELRDADSYQASAKTTHDIKQWLKLDSAPLELRRYADRPSQTIDSVVSRYFRSAYYLYYVGFDESPPRDLLLTRRIGEQEITYLSSEDFALKYLTLDWIVGRTVDSSEALELAFDIMTILSTRYPVYVVKDLDEVRRLRRIVTWSDFWSNPGTSMLLKRVLSSFRQCSLASLVDSISITGLRPTPGNEYVDEYGGQVAAPSVSIDTTGSATVRMSTWTPRGGYLVTWEIQFSRSGGLRVSNRTIAKEVGFEFHYL